MKLDGRGNKVISTTNNKRLNFTHKLHSKIVFMPFIFCSVNDEYKMVKNNYVLLK